MLANEKAEDELFALAHTIALAPFPLDYSLLPLLTRVLRAPYAVTEAAQRFLSELVRSAALLRQLELLITLFPLCVPLTATRALLDALRASIALVPKAQANVIAATVVEGLAEERSVHGQPKLDAGLSQVACMVLDALPFTPSHSSVMLLLAPIIAAPSDPTQATLALHIYSVCRRKDFAALTQPFLSEPHTAELSTLLARVEEPAALAPVIVGRICELQRLVEFPSSIDGVEEPHVEIERLLNVLFAFPSVPLSPEVSKLLPVLLRAADSASISCWIEKMLNSSRNELRKHFVDHFASAELYELVQFRTALLHVLLRVFAHRLRKCAGLSTTVDALLRPLDELGDFSTLLGAAASLGDELTALPHIDVPLYNMQRVHEVVQLCLSLPARVLTAAPSRTRVALCLTSLIALVLSVRPRLCRCCPLTSLAAVFRSLTYLFSLAFTPFCAVADALLLRAPPVQPHWPS